MGAWEGTSSVLACTDAWARGLDMQQAQNPLQGLATLGACV